LPQRAIGNDHELALGGPQLGHPQVELLDGARDARGLPGLGEPDYVPEAELVLGEQKETGQKIADYLLRAETKGDRDSVHLIQRMRRTPPSTMTTPGRRSSRSQRATASKRIQPH
jgi:hypothetical protein